MYVMNVFLRLTVQFVLVTLFFQLYGHHDLVVNCAGLGSRQLVGDTHLRPYRGQMIRVGARGHLEDFNFGEGNKSACTVVGVR